MKLEEIVKQLSIEIKDFKDLHITRNFSSFVAVSEGQVVGMTDPWMDHCPLFSMLYEKDEPADKQELKQMIQKAVEKKIEKFGSFTSHRQLIRDDIAVPFGASEMMMYALKKNAIDAAVCVCDGAGTVISSSPSLVQGIGARMNGLFYTSPIPEVIQEIEKHNGIVVFPDTGEINQIEGLICAAESGYRKIAVTVNGFTEENLSRIPEIEKKYSITAVCIIVCTTGVTEARAHMIAQYADLIWSCGPGKIREIVGPESIIQITLAIPVFVKTDKGIDFISAYCSDPDIITGLSPDKQYLIAGNVRGLPLTMGTYSTQIVEQELPVRSSKEPG